jgi:hypothetical protein
MRKGVPLRLKPTDWESVFRSTKEEFCRPRSVRLLLQRRTKIHNRTSCRLRLMACRARGSGRHHANCYYLLLTCNGRLHKLPGARYPVPSNRSTIADIPVLTRTSMSDFASIALTPGGMRVLVRKLVEVEPTPSKSLLRKCLTEHRGLRNQSEIVLRECEA